MRFEITLRRVIADHARVALCVTLSATAGHARGGIKLDRFDPAEQGSRWFLADSLNISARRRLAAGIVTDWGTDPLVTYDADGEQATAVVADQVFLRAGASYTFWEGTRIGLNVPILLYQNGSDASLGSVQLSGGNDAALGDLRLGVSQLLFGGAGEALSGAVGLWLYLPTGDEAAYTSDGSVAVQPRMQIAGRAGVFGYAAHTAVHVRSESDHLAQASVGTEVQVGGAGGVFLMHDRLLIGPEIWASTVISEGSDAFLSDASTPLEMQIGAHFDATPEWRVGLGFGPGLTSGVGSPTARWIASVAWIPSEEEARPAPPEPVPSADSDADGIADPADACPALSGVPDPSPERNGCPAETLTRDTDGDGVFDSDDACTNAPGEPNPDRTRNGCPKANIEGSQIVIRDRILFEPAQARLSEGNEQVLSAVASVLAQHPEITKLRVEGHTDDKGTIAFNAELSRKRAEAVVAWLVEHGIASSRLSFEGYGLQRPLDTTDSDDARARNRRVEFRIVELDGQADSGTRTK